MTDEKEIAEDGVNARQRKSKANEADVLGGECSTQALEVLGVEMISRKSTADGRCG